VRIGDIHKNINEKAQGGRQRKDMSHAEAQRTQRKVVILRDSARRSCFLARIARILKEFTRFRGGSGFEMSAEGALYEICAIRFHGDSSAPWVTGPGGCNLLKPLEIQHQTKDRAHRIRADHHAEVRRRVQNIIKRRHGG